MFFGFLFSGSGLPLLSSVNLLYVLMPADQISSGMMIKLELKLNEPSSLCFFIYLPGIKDCPTEYDGLAEYY